MPRTRRTIYPGVPQHVTQRGNRQAQVFFTDRDRRNYLELLHEYGEKHRVEVLAYCLMTNHVHLVVVPETADGLHHMLRPLHMRHAQRVNLVRGWKGHLWQGRYFASMLDDRYLWAAIRYVERNPVRAAMVERAEDYRWSSAAAHCRLRPDEVLTSSPSWWRQFEAIGDWSSWLAAGDQPECLDTLRRHVNKGLPCGSSGFLDGLERATGRILRPRPPGRPKRGVNQDGDATPFRGARPGQRKRIRARHSERK